MFVSALSLPGFGPDIELPGLSLTRAINQTRSATTADAAGDNKSGQQAHFVAGGVVVTDRMTAISRAGPSRDNALLSDR